MKSSTFAVLFALTLAGAAPATAQEIQFSGSSLGCFGENCTPTSFASSDHLGFFGNSFSGLTDNGALTLDFGYFAWDALGEYYVDSPFTLFLSFTAPTGIDPDPVYFGGVEGVVIRGKVNGIRVGSSTTQLVFEPNQRSYTFTGGNPNVDGTFTLTLRDTYIDPLRASKIYGDVSHATVTPEPMSMILMGSGLAGLAAARRRRKRQQTEV
ncbi:MAG TPA: PEP-CTERM sorting domain-containing protein [Longimicrobiales bacterium]|nr:PEP-CTERM sorting domain-containing protein [Longimicrobiales bacterium]